MRSEADYFHLSSDVFIYSANNKNGIERRYVDSSILYISISINKMVCMNEVKQ